MGKSTNGLGYKLILTRNSDNAILNKNNATTIGKIKINSPDWYVLHYTASIDQERVTMKQIIDKIPPELQYKERSVFMKEVNTQKLWIFELGTQDGMNVLICIIIGFQQRERQKSQKLAKDAFYRPPMTSAQCIIETEKYPGSAVLIIYNDDDYSQGYGEIEEAFKALTKDDILHPYISEHDFRSSNDGNNIGYNLYLFDIRYQKNFESAQPIKLAILFSENVAAGIYGYALVLTNKLISKAVMVKDILI